MHRRLVPLAAMIALLVATQLPAATEPSKGALRMVADGDVVLRVLTAPLPTAFAADLSDPHGDKSWGLAVWMKPGRDVAAMVSALTSLGAAPVALSLRPEGARLLLTAPAGQGSKIRKTALERPDVAAVTAWGVPELMNDESVWIGQSNDRITRATPIFDRGLTGTGEVVSVWDTGTDPDMCYFVYATGDYPLAQELIPPDTGIVDPTRKIWAYYVSPGAGAYDSWRGHGTGVAGCVLGDNFLTPSTPSSGGHDAADGMAPNASLIVLDGWGDYGESGIVGDLSPMLLQAYKAGARIQNHSWGTPENFYAADAADLDRFVWRHEDFLIVNAAGNSGVSPGDATVIDPATAKNLLSVGATVNGITNFAGDLATFTSRGPTFDGRLKPDIVAPGVRQRTADASGVLGDVTCGEFIKSGTSFSSPTAAGWAALARQYLREGFLPSGTRTVDDATRPSAALVKAMMITSAIPLEGTDPYTNAPVPLPPSLDQGWGRPLLEEALFFTGETRRTTVLDLPNRAGLRDGESGRLDINIPNSSEPLDVVLVWTDPPSPPAAQFLLANDLDLVVTDPGGTTYLGNVWSGGASITGGTPDRVDNVEGARIAAPTPGVWSIRVDVAGPLGQPGITGSDRQGFALVITHADCGPSALPPTGLTSSEAPIGISLSWQNPPGAFSYRVYRTTVASPTAADFELITPTGVTVPSYTDRDVQCGVTYTYRVRAWNNCTLSAASDPTTRARTLGSCSLPPEFAGLADARPAGPCRQITLSWPAATSQCACSTGLVYNVWASSTLPVDPATAPIASCVAATSLTVDVGSQTALRHYVVRAEDRVPGGTGLCGGVSDVNLVTVATVPTSPTRQVTLRDDFDSGRSLWSREVFVGVHSWDIQVEPFARSTTRALRADDQKFTSDSVARLRPAITPTIDTLVSLWHTYNIEGRFDGGVIELSTDGGMSWFDAGSRLVAGHYDDWLSTGPGSATLRPGFTAGSLGPMTESLVWLGELAAQDVHLRLRMLTDDSGRREYWAVDDVEVFDRDCPTTANALVAGFSHDGPACLGSPICFDASASYGGVAPYTMVWDFGDGSPPEFGSAPCHAFPFAATFQVTLNVADSNGAADVVTMPVVVADEVAGPGLGNTLRAARSGVHYTLTWTEPPGAWLGTEMRTATQPNLSDLATTVVVPWDEPRSYKRWYGSFESPALRLWQVGLLSTCRGTPGP